MNEINNVTGRQLSKAQIYAKARATLQVYWGRNTPVNLKRVAKRMGITLEYLPLNQKLSGMSFIEGEKAYIGVNSLHSSNRQRFTIAHEIGHHVLHEALLRSGTHVDTIVLRRDHLSAQGTDALEVQANAFASELLVPKALLESKVSSDADMQDEELLERLAAELKVSTMALHYRLTRG